MKVKHILIVFIIGFVFVIVGSLFKILHLQGAQALLIIGMGGQALGGVLSIWKLIKTKSFKSFLDS